jgi:hypothetical protein
VGRVFKNFDPDKRGLRKNQSKKGIFKKFNASVEVQK